ncbi:MAG TPA: von Willebrand factor type A domain-containing protein [Verrucomicrobiae bacterium]|jgi:Mg-chelatase subunit ChlD/tetratricopeptide (TPR) repeat protein|nr:von Willebrand factor type A domain-containing protein [Verrucomicrobiae bacterium]
MTPDFPQNEREQLEAKLTAFLLGELPPDETVALCQAMEHDPELAALYKQLKVTVELVRESAAEPVTEKAAPSAPLKLSGERREKLLAQFKTLAPEEFAQPRRVMDWLIPVAAVAAMVMILAALLLPALSRSKTRAQHTSAKTGVINNLRLLEGAKQQWALENNKSADAEPTLKELKPYLGRGSSESGIPAVAGETYVPGKVSESPVAELSASQARRMLSKGDLSKAEKRDGNVELSLDEPTGAILAQNNSEPKPASSPAVTTGTSSVLANQEPQIVLPEGGQVAANYQFGMVTNSLASALEQQSNTLPSVNNPFVARYGYLALPPGQAVDLGGIQPQTDQRNYAESGNINTENGARGFDWYRNYLQGESLGGTTPTVALATNEVASNKNPILGDLPSMGRMFRSKDELADANRSPRGTFLGDASQDDKIKSAQLVQDGKLMLQMGKSDEAEGKLKEALARDPNNQAALYYENLVKQTHERQLADGRNTTSMQKMTALENLGDRRAKNDSTIWVAPGASQMGAVPGVAGNASQMQTHAVKVDPQTFYSALQADRVRQSGGGRAPLLTNDSRGLRYVTGLDPTAEIQTAVNRFLHDQGVNLGPSESVFFNDRQGTLTVHATTEDLDKIQVVMDKLNANPASGQSFAPLGTVSKGQLADEDKKVKLAQAQVDKIQTDTDQLITKTKVVQQEKAAADQNDTALPKPAIPPPTPQPEILTRENAFSTFSLNVSDVSFKLAAASLKNGRLPEPASIRSEEFINAFDYRDPAALPGVPIAFASERVVYPFAHNRELLRFSLKTAASGREAGRPLNIVLLLDNSGSMERADRVRIIQEALRVLAGQLQAQDTFSIVTFARTARLRVDGIPGNQAVAAIAEIAGLTPEGGTDLGAALDVAYETALHHYLANGDNRVVMLTDGAANLGDVNAGTLKQKVEAHRKQGVALDCFGIGWEGYNDDLLEVLTRNGDGRYGFINTPEEAGTEFVAQIAGALHVAAADVKVQVEFNPKRVISYRQIGYAKHQLTKEQFRDNTVDAAEIAAQEAGNALYTIETNPQGEGSIATVRVRYKVPGTSEYREQAWDVAYTGGAVALDQASAAMRLAATASAFSEWLATSPFAAEVTPEALLRYLNGVPQIYGADTRPAKLEWMIRQAQSISGK